jgi:hypothetical protein
MVGNSLVPMFEGEPLQIDWGKKYSHGTASDFIKNIRQGLTEITDLQRQFFNADSKNKKALSQKIRQTKINILINQLKFDKEKYRESNSKKGGLMPTPKEIKQNLEVDLQIQTFNNNIHNLEKLEKDTSKPLNYFSWELDFPDILNPLLNDKCGFDIIIGNPPYIKEYTNKNAFDGFRANKYYQGKMDLWYGFACIGLDLLNKNGLECFIAQNNWITSSGASILRNKILNDTEIKIFTDFEDYKVFKSAGIQTMIYLLKKSNNNAPFETQYSVLKNSNVKIEQIAHFLNFEENSNDTFERFLFTINKENFINKTISFNSSVTSILVKVIEKKGIVRLDKKDVAQGIVAPQDNLNKKNKKILGDDFNVGDGIFQINNFELSKLDLLKNEYEIIKPFYSTTELGRYYGDRKNDTWIIYTSTTAIKSMEKYPNIKRHLDKYSRIITSSNKPCKFKLISEEE